MALLTQLADKNSENAQVEYRKDYDKHVLFGLRFAASNYVLPERHSVMESAANGMGYEAYWNTCPAE